MNFLQTSSIFDREKHSYTRRANTMWHAQFQLDNRMWHGLFMFIVCLWGTNGNSDAELCEAIVMLHCIVFISKPFTCMAIRFERRKRATTKNTRIEQERHLNSLQRNRTEQNRMELNVRRRKSALTVINNNWKKLFSLFNTHSADRMKIACHTICSLYSVFTFYSHLRWLFFIAFGFSDTSRCVRILFSRCVFPWGMHTERLSEFCMNFFNLSSIKWTWTLCKNKKNE